MVKKMECAITVYPVYKNIPTAVIEELLVCTREAINAVDRYTFTLKVNEGRNHHWTYQERFLMYVQCSYKGEVPNAGSFICSIVTGSRCCLLQKSFLVK